MCELCGTGKDDIHDCELCGAILNRDGECENCPPDDYVHPGSEVIMYLNAYSVTRRYGGPEEGGWYYNHREPIASIPIVGVSTPEHGNECQQCHDVFQ